MRFRFRRNPALWGQKRGRLRIPNLFSPGFAHVHNPAYTHDHASIAKAFEASGRMLLNSGLQTEAKQVRRKGKRCQRMSKPARTRA